MFKITASTNVIHASLFNVLPMERPPDAPTPILGRLPEDMRVGKILPFRYGV